MKKIIFNISILFLGLSMSLSCSVDRMPEATLTDQFFWETPENLRLAANFFYTGLPGLSSEDVTQDNWSSDGFPISGNNTISDGSRVAPAQDTLNYRRNYYNIYQANKLIEMAPQVISRGGSETLVNSYVGEARFFRALFYFDMFCRYGGVPLIDRTVDEDDPAIFLARSSREEL
ncbi:RagB/SusD family nutrient uptake outer membrane protein, partial [Brucella sp. 21LCYQ03]|nr:RagB/SusD family nutrient uptake outer membrane protein [Brucella sp. 21LCYQ03]